MINHIVLAVLCCLAVIQDISTRKIKNIFNVLSAVAALICVIITKEVSIVDGLLGLLSGFLLGIFMWRIGAIRAGDAKFMWTIGILKGWKYFWLSMIWAILAGGVIALFIMLFKKDFRKRFTRLWLYLKGAVLTKSAERYEPEKPEEFPFSVPLAIGCTVEYALRLMGYGFW